MKQRIFVGGEVFQPGIGLPNVIPTQTSTYSNINRDTRQSESGGSICCGAGRGRGTQYATGIRVGGSLLLLSKRGYCLKLLRGRIEGCLVNSQVRHLLYHSDSLFQAIESEGEAQLFQVSVM